MSAFIPYKNFDYILGKQVNRPDLPPLGWNPDGRDTNNPHGLICGESGAGKTTLLKDLVTYLTMRGKHLFVFDLKGDLIFHDNDGNKIGNYIDFTAWDSEYGISFYEFDTGVSQSELKLLIDNPNSMSTEQRFKIQNSGPKVQVARLIEILVSKFFPNMGVKQKDYLRHLFMDTYLMNGFIYNDISTWLNKLPSLKDTLELIEMIKKHNNVGSNNDDELSRDFIDSIKPEIVNIDILKDRLVSKDPLDDDKEAIKKHIDAKEKYLDNAYKEYLDNTKGKFKKADILKLSHEKWFEEKRINPTKYESKEAIRKIDELASYLTSLNESEIFKEEKPPVKAGLNVINISGLDIPIQRVLVDIWLGKVFRACKIRGEYSKRTNKERGEKVDTYFIVDETKLISGNSREKNDPYSYLNRTATESRGFGLGILVAAQSAEHYPPEFLKNFHLQIILKTSIADSEIVRKSFDVDKETLKFTQKGWGNALIKSGQNFVKVKLGSHVPIAA